MTISTLMGQNINAVPHYGGVKIVIECSDDVREPVEITMSADEWSALVFQGFKAIAAGGQ